MSEQALQNQVAQQDFTEKCENKKRLFMVFYMIAGFNVSGEVLYESEDGSFINKKELKDAIIEYNIEKIKSNPFVIITYSNIIIMGMIELTKKDYDEWIAGSNNDNNNEINQNNEKNNANNQ